MNNPNDPDSFLPPPARAYLQSRGHSLKEFQKEAVLQTLNGNDTMIVVATGAGKSLCYQIAPLLLDGVVLVISPLIALVQDQVRGLLESESMGRSRSASSGSSGSSASSSGAGFGGSGINVGNNMNIDNNGVIILDDESQDVNNHGNNPNLNNAGINNDADVEPSLLRPIAVGGGVTVTDLQLTDANLIFASPEWVNCNAERIRTVLGGGGPGKLKLVAVDEAHCVSQWGHDFRPEYKKLADNLYKRVGICRSGNDIVPIMCLTATAPQDVKREIHSAMKLRPTCSLIQDQMNRPELEYRVCFRDTDDHAFGELQHVLRDVLRGLNQNQMGFGNGGQAEKPCAIIYTVLKEEAETLASKLNIPFYHGGLSSKKRSEIAKDFASAKNPVVVCTVAFGMGIDQPQVRYVIHYGAPNSLLGYIQQCGRAGRDGKEAKCVCIVRKNDRARALRRCQNQREMKNHEEIWGFLEMQSCRREKILNILEEGLGCWRSGNGRIGCCSLVEPINMAGNGGVSSSSSKRGRLIDWIQVANNNNMIPPGLRVYCGKCDCCAANPIEIISVEGNGNFNFQTPNNPRQGQQPQQNMQQQPPSQQGFQQQQPPPQPPQQNFQQPPPQQNPSQQGLDFTSDACLMIHAANSCGGQTGLGKIIEVLRGKASKANKERGLERKVDIFGKGKHHSQEFWKAFASVLSNGHFKLMESSLQSMASSGITYSAWKSTSKGKMLLGLKEKVENGKLVEIPEGDRVVLQHPLPRDLELALKDENDKAQAGGRGGGRGGGGGGAGSSSGGNIFESSGGSGGRRRGVQGFLDLPIPSDSVGSDALFEELTRIAKNEKNTLPEYVTKSGGVFLRNFAEKRPRNITEAMGVAGYMGGIPPSVLDKFMTACGGATIDEMIIPESVVFPAKKSSAKSSPGSNEWLRHIRAEPTLTSSGSGSASHVAATPKTTSSVISISSSGSVKSVMDALDKFSYSGDDVDDDGVRRGKRANNRDEKPRIGVGFGRGNRTSSGAGGGAASSSSAGPSRVSNQQQQEVPPMKKTRTLPFEKKEPVNTFVVNQFGPPPMATATNANTANANASSSSGRYDSLAMFAFGAGAGVPSSSNNSNANAKSRSSSGFGTSAPKPSQFGSTTTGTATTGTGTRIATGGGGTAGVGSGGASSSYTPSFQVNEFAPVARRNRPREPDTELDELLAGLPPAKRPKSIGYGGGFGNQFG